MAIAQTRSRRGLVAIASVIVMVLVSAESCNQPPDHVMAVVEDRISGLLDDIGAEGWRIHVHPKIIGSGVSIASFTLSGPEHPSEQMTCHHRCLLFFVDTQPLAHFAHPTVIALFDLQTGTAQVMGAEWWPTIDGRSVFYTAASRRDSRTIVRSHNLPPPPPPSIPRVQLAAELAAPDPPGGPSTVGPGSILYSALPPAPTPLGGSESQDVYAVLVEGFKDPSATFYVDVVGMYGVLRGNGVPAEHIQVLSGTDLKDFGIDEQPQVSVEELQEAIKQAKQDMASSEAPEFLLFFSTHGQKTDGLACGTDPDYAEQPPESQSVERVEPDQLQSMLEALPDNASIAVVIEACHSGEFVNTFNNNNFRKDKAPWRMFVSAEEGDTSSGDVDTVNDKNPADSGSETIWGYLEAFGTRAADGNGNGGGNGTVDFAEAVSYANVYDATELHDGMSYPPTPTPGVPVHASDQIQPGGTLQVTFDDPCSQSTDDQGTACANTVTRCCDAGVTLTLRNTANQPASMPLALRVFRSNSASDWEPHYFEDDNWRTTVIVGGLDAQEATKLRFELGEVPSSFHKGQEVTLQAVVDHLEASTGGGPATSSATATMKFKVRNCTLNVCCWLSKCFCPD